MIRLKLWANSIRREKLSEDDDEEEPTARNYSIVSPKKPSLNIFYDYSIFIATIIPSSFGLRVRIIAPRSINGMEIIPLLVIRLVTWKLKDARATLKIMAKTTAK